MINQIYVDMLAFKIFNIEINPLTQKAFCIDDIKKEEYKQPVLEKIEILKSQKEEVI